MVQYFLYQSNRIYFLYLYIKGASQYSHILKLIVFDLFRTSYTKIKKEYRVETTRDRVRSIFESDSERKEAVRKIHVLGSIYNTVDFNIRYFSDYPLNI